RRVDGQGVSELADVERPAVLGPVHEEAARPVEIVPLPLVHAPAVEDLHAVVLAIRDVDEPVAVRYEVVRQVELAGVLARPAPGPEELAVAVEDDDGVRAAREAEDVVLGVHGDARHLDEVPAFGQLAPAVYDLKVHRAL